MNTEELTRIPNRGDALVYRECLTDALDKNGVRHEENIVTHYDAQFSEVVVNVHPDDYRKALDVMREVAESGPPSEETG